MDYASIAKLQLLHPMAKAAGLSAWTEACNAIPINEHPQIIQTYRSIAESDHDFQLGRTIINPDGQCEDKPMGNIISNAPGGHSWHNYALALDLVMLIDGKESWTVNDLVVSIFKKHGFTWGGDFTGSFKDYPHFEMKFGLTTAQALAKYNARDFILGTNYINI